MRFSTLFFLLLINIIRAQTYEIIQNKISALLNTLPENTNTAIMILNPETGDTVYAKNIYRKMIPASNTKLFTTAVALSMLGTDYQLKTSLLTDGNKTTDGIISGNLYLRGSGDPTLSLSKIDSLVILLKSEGIKKIEGDICGDDTYFDKIYSRDDWITGERSNVRLTPVSALALNRNRITVTLDAGGKTGSRLKHSVLPGDELIDVNTTARITKFRSKPQFLVRNTTEGNSLRITGGLRGRRYTRSYALDVQSPPLFAANILRKKLERAGIKVTGKTREAAAPEGSRLINSISVLLETILSLANKESDNFAAECLFKLLGAHFSGEVGNSFYATQAVMTFIEESEIYSEGTAVVDGSGISRYNEITVAAITGLLQNLYFNDNLFNAYYNSLAVAGVDGTLEDRMYNSFAFNNFHGKTGTLNGVSAISGYLTSQNEEPFIVSMIMEFKRGGSGRHRNIQDKIIELVTEML